MTLMKRTLAAAFSLIISGPFFLAARDSSPLPKEPFGKTSSGHEVFLYTLKNASGMEVKITNYGGTIQSVRVKDRHGKFGDVVLGFSTLDGYTSKTNNAYFGALI